MNAAEQLVELDSCSLIENTIIPHAAYEKACKRLEMCFRYATRGGEPMCMAIVGESGTGKSRVLEEFERDHAPNRTREGLYVPVLRIKTPSKPTVKGLVEEMLNKLDDPASKRSSEQKMTARLRKLLVACGTKVVCVDEFQHFRDKASDKVAHHVADWLKVLADESKVALVVAGLPVCRSIINHNEQLARRFRGVISMPRFRWEGTDEGGKDNREEFVAILNTFDDRIRTRFDMPELGSEEMAFRCYCACGGLMGYLVNILHQAILEADFDERTVITLDHLKAAAENAVWEGSRFTDPCSPFDRKFKCSWDEACLAKAALVGQPIPEPPKPRRTRRAASGDSVNAHLSAS